MPLLLPSHVDVAVIGGGPAGSSAARLLSDWGHSVLLVDRGAGRNPLAESLPPSATRLLETIGVRQAVDEAGFVTATGNTVWWGDGVMRIEPFPEGKRGYQVLSTTFDAVLRQHAAKGGARVLQPATALGVGTVGSVGDEAHLVTIELDGARHEVRATWVLDCTGRAGFMSRTVSRRVERAARTVALVGVWERDGGWELPDETHTLVESSPRGWGWSIPVSATTRFFTVMLDPGHARVADRGGAAAQYSEEVARLPALGEVAARGRLTAPPWACDATPYAHQPVVAPRTLLVGDAASCIDPLSSFGVKKALATGWLAAITVNTARRSPHLTVQATTFYAEREREFERAASQRLAALSRDAMGPGDSPFWESRAALAEDGDDDDMVQRLRRDADVLQAFEQLKERPSVALRRSGHYREEPRLLIRGNQMALEPHLTMSPFSHGLRYLRGVDLVTVAAIATTESDVGGMYDHYVRRNGPISLPDFLGALSVLVGKGGLEFT